MKVGDMAFEVPKSKKDLPENRYEFTIDGETYSVPKLGFLSGEVVDLLAEAENKGGIHDTAAQYAIFGPKGSAEGDAVRTLEREQLLALLEDYQAASRVTVGESPASTDS